MTSEPVSIHRIAAQLAGGGSCDNCGQPLAAHCTACLIPCCLGKCPAAWPPQRYGGEHYRPDGVLCAYLAFIACNKCGGPAPPEPAT